MSINVSELTDDEKHRIITETPLIAATGSIEFVAVGFAILEMRAFLVKQSRRRDIRIGHIDYYTGIITRQFEVFIHGPLLLVDGWISATYDMIYDKYGEDSFA